ncbi:hypothetical protein JCM5296_004798 [Sporobolomyces johnsonii]
MLLPSVLLSVLSAVAVTASPAPLLNRDGQLVLTGAAQEAVSWGAGKLSQIGTQDGGVETMTKWDWYDCGLPTDALQIDSLRISPDPPKPGQNLTIYATGRAQSLVDFGSYADVTVKLGLIKLLTKRFDVCDELDNANATLRCPITPDSYEIEQTVELPREIPKAKFQVNAQVFTQDDEPAACIDLWINFLVPDLQQQ